MEENRATPPSSSYFPWLLMKECEGQRRYRNQMANQQAQGQAVGPLIQGTGWGLTNGRDKGRPGGPICGDPWQRGGQCRAKQHPRNHTHPLCGDHHITEATKARRNHSKTREPSLLQVEVGLAGDLVKLPPQPQELVPSKEQSVSWAHYGPFSC